MPRPRSASRTNIRFTSPVAASSSRSAAQPTGRSPARATNTDTRGSPASAELRPAITAPGYRRCSSRSRVSMRSSASAEAASTRAITIASTAIIRHHGVHTRETLLPDPERAPEVEDLGDVIRGMVDDEQQLAQHRLSGSVRYLAEQIDARVHDQ